MAVMFKKKAGVGILMLPGFGRVHDDTILVGEHFAKFKDHLEEYIPALPAAEPVPAPEVAVDKAIPNTEKTVLTVDVGDLSSEESLKLIEDVKTLYEGSKAEEPVAPKAEKKSKGKK